jgi:uncharacterized pyridoxal phosphate-containing UPF0001 family protein
MISVIIADHYLIFAMLIMKLRGLICMADIVKNHNQIQSSFLSVKMCQKESYQTAHQLQDLIAGKSPSDPAVDLGCTAWNKW